MKLCRSEF